MDGPAGADSLSVGDDGRSRKLGTTPLVCPLHGTQPIAEPPADGPLWVRPYGFASLHQTI